MNKLKIDYKSYYTKMYKQAFEITLRKLQHRLADVAKLDFYKNIAHTSADDGYYTNELIKTIMFIKTRRVRLSTLADVVRVTCGHSELELITTKLKVVFFSFLNKCDEVVELLEKNLENK